MDRMDWDKILTIGTVWMIVAITAFFADWYTVIPASVALYATAVIARA